MSHPQRSGLLRRWIKSPIGLLRRGTKQLRRARRRQFMLAEALEPRLLMATVRWTNLNGGDWSTRTNWDTGNLPGINDDVIIDVTTSPTITFNSPTAVSVNSLDLRENLVIAGGTFGSKTIAQSGGTLRMSGGTLKDSRVTLGQLTVNTVGSAVATFSNVTIDPGTSLVVTAASKVTIAPATELGIFGTATLNTGSELTLNQNANLVVSHVLVGAGGTLNVLGATVKRTGARAPYIQVQAAGRLFASNSTFNTVIYIDNGALYDLDNWSNSRFNNDVHLPYRVLQSLSNATSNKENLGYSTIYIYGDTLVDGVLNLKKIGLDTTNLSYVFEGSFIVESLATLNINSVPTTLLSNKVLTVKGRANIDNGTTFTLFQSSVSTPNTSIVVSNSGVLSITGSTVNATGNQAARTLIDVQATGRMLASNSTFSLGKVQLAKSAIFQANDWTRNTFTSDVFLPINVIPLLDVAGAGKNFKFSRLYIHSDTLTSGTVTFGSYSVDTTTLIYIFNGAFKIDSAATINVANNISVDTITETLITVAGRFNFADGSKLTLTETSSGTPQSTLVIASGGIASFTGATILGAGFQAGLTSISAQAGGRLQATRSKFSVGSINMATGVIFDRDWTQNTFECDVYLPYTIIPTLNLPAATRNLAFGNLFIHSATMTGTLDLGVICNDTTNLNYFFNGAFTVGTGATLNVGTFIRVWTVTATPLTILGTMNLAKGAQFTLLQTSGSGTASSLNINSGGVVNATEATFTADGNRYDRTTLNVNSGGSLRSTGSTFSYLSVSLGNASIFTSTDWTQNRFFSDIYLPHTIIPLISNNTQFGNLFISTGTLASGTLNLNAIGTDTSLLMYHFLGDFTVNSGATLNVGTTVRTWIASSVNVSVFGTANFNPGSTLGFFQTSTTTKRAALIVKASGTVKADAASFFQAGNRGDLTSVTVEASGRLLAQDTNFTVGFITLNAAANFTPGDWARNRFETILTVPARVVAGLSKADGGEDQLRFNEIHLLPGTQASGDLRLRALGSEGTASLSYTFDGDFTIASGARLIVDPGVRARIASTMGLTINGTASFDVGSSLTFLQPGSSSRISRLILGSTGTLNTNGATFVRSGITPTITTYDIQGTATVSSFNSSFQGIMAIAAGANVNFLQKGSSQTITNLRNQLLTNYRSIDLQQGSTLTLGQPLQVGNSTTDPASVKLSYSSTLIVTGSLTGKTRTPANFVPAGRVVINSTQFPQLEVMSDDLGAVSSGFVNNFAYGRLELTANTYVQLINADVNSSAGKSEAIYVNTLVVPAGATLDLNGRKLYVRAASIAGRVIDGANAAQPIFVADGGPLQFATPTPGNIDASPQDVWTFTAPENAPVMIQVNPGLNGINGAVPQTLRRVRVELVDSGNVVQFAENDADGNVVTLLSGNLVAGRQYSIRIKAHSGFATLQGNYVVTLLQAGTGETALSLTTDPDSFNKPEGNSGVTPFVFTVTRFGDLSLPGTVNWTVTGTGLTPATAGDFQGALTGTVSFATPSEVSKTITVNVNGDVNFENDEAFKITLSNPSNGMVLAIPSVTSTIVNDDSQNNADLIVSAINPPTLATTSQTVTLGWTEKNVGSILVTGTWRTHVRVVNLSTNRTVFDEAREFTNNALVKDGTVNRSLQFTLPDGNPGVGNYEVTITVDSGRVITETNPNDTGETNNTTTARFDVSLANYPDLTVSALDAPPSIQLSQPFNISWRVRNSGNAIQTVSFSDRIYLSKDGVIDSSDMVLDTFVTTSKLPLAPGAEYSTSTPIVLPLDGSIDAGTYQLLLASDFQNVQFELNEADNRVARTVLITLPPLPDLIVDDIQTRDVTAAGQSIPVTWVIKNQGTADVDGSWVDRLWLSSDATIGQDIPLGDFPVTVAIDAGDSIQRTQLVTIPVGLSGDYRIVVTTDKDNSIDEYNKENNNSSIDNLILAIDPRPSANLVIDSITAPTSNLFTGQAVTVEWVIRNTGNDSTGSTGWEDRVYVSADTILDNDDRLLGRVQNPAALDINQQYRSTLTAPLPEDTVGQWFFIVVTDATNRVRETGGELDNVLASDEATITLTPPVDLVVTSVVSTNLASEGTDINVSWTVKNQGLGPTRVNSWTDQVYLSFNGSDLDNSDTFLGSFKRDGALAVDGTYQVRDFAVSLPPNRISDAAYLIVRTDALRSVYEHNFEGNNDTASQPLKIVLRPQPDLTVDTVTVPSSATAGQPLRVSYRVVNTASTATRQSSWRDAVYLSSDQVLSPESDMFLGSISRTGILGPEQSETRQRDFRLPDTLSGNFYVIVATDSNNEVFEASDDNNVTAAGNVTSVVINPPDLRASTVLASGSLRAGREVSVTYTVTNIGASPTPNDGWHDAIYLSSDDRLDGADRLLSERFRSGVLAAGASEIRTVGLRLPGDLVGTAFLIVRSDNRDQVFELNNDNNVASVGIQIGDDRPDLTISQFVPRLPAQEILPGTTLSANMTIVNQGLGATYGSQWFDRVWLSRDTIVGNNDDVLLGSWANPQQLGLGQSYSRLVESLRIPVSTADGQYHLILQTDARGDLGEGDETNNLLVSDSFTVTRTPGGVPVPDLRPTLVEVPSAITSGSSLNIRWKVQNAGADTAANALWYDHLWLSQDNVIDSSDILIGKFLHGDQLKANGEYTQVISWPMGIDLVGNYSVIVSVDATNRVFEGAAENNNLRVSIPISITLGPVPDLRVSAINLPDPAIASSGRPYSFGWTVTNTGTVPAAGPWIDRAYLSLDQIFDPSTDISIGFAERRQSLPAGGTYTVTPQLQIPAGLNGSYFVFVVTDTTKRVYERQNENNNTLLATRVLQINRLPPADLVVGTITLPSTTELNQPATISFTVTNTGSNNAQGGWYDSIYLSSDDQWDIDDGFFGRVQRTADVAAGSSYTSTLTANLPGVVPGDYKVIIRSDIRNYLIEDNETNNLKASLTSFETKVPALALGVATTGSITVGSSLYYKVNVPAGETLAIEFDASQTTGAIELYSSFGTMPRRALAEHVSVDPYSTKQRIVISNTQGGTYYILAVAQELTTTPVQFSIKARIVPFTVFDESFGQGGTAGDRTIQINGAKFDRSVTVELVDSDNRAVPAVRYTRTSATRLYATFDLRSLTRGMYTVRLNKASSGETIPIANAFQVVYAAIHPDPISLTRPDAFNRRRNDRPPAIIPVSLGWRNTSLNDVPVPLIHFSATDPFALTMAQAKAGQTVSSTEFLGFAQSDGPRDILLPGDYGLAEFFIAPVAVSASAPPMDIHYVAEAFYEPNSAVYVWDYDLSQLDLSYLSDEEARTAIDDFRATYQGNIGALREALTVATRRAGPETLTDFPTASRRLLQDVFDRFVAGRSTSLSGTVSIADLGVSYETLVVTLLSTNSPDKYSTEVLADGSFVFPQVKPGSYQVRVTGGAVKAADNLSVQIATGERAQLTINLLPATASVADAVPARVPLGLATVAAPHITVPGQIDQVLSGNVLTAVQTQLNGLNYRVEQIGEAPAGFALESDGSFRFLSSEITAFVVHYDLVLSDVDSRAGQLLGSEIRSRGSIAITLKNNFTRDVRSLDPNDITGPVGYGDLKWVSATERLPYTIRFENDPNQASSAALSVTITQTLDSDLDPASVEFGSFGFGGMQFTPPPKMQSLSQDLDLRQQLGIYVRVFAFIDYAKGEISWTFTSIAPDTGDQASDPTVGFLPLNVAPPEGDGFASYTVRAKRSATAGTTIHARARILFDGNAPIDTPEIFNTLDNNLPVSSIVAAQTQAPDSRLLVSWDGDDSQPGAGVSSFDVYVAENGGRYRLWLANTQLLEKEYAATAGSTYTFITIARDNVGNLEPITKIPDASRPLAFAGGPYTLMEGVGQALNGTAKDPDSTITSFIYQWDLDYDGITFDVDSTEQSPTLTVPDNIDNRVVALRVKGTAADAVPSLISTAVVKVQNAAPVVSSSQSSISGFVNSVLRTSGSWSDQAADTVSLIASIGTIIKNANGTWDWSYESLTAVDNQLVTITASDEDGGVSTTTFTFTARINTETFKPIISASVPAIIRQEQVTVSINFGQVVRGFTNDDLQLTNATVVSLTDQGNGRYQGVIRASAFGLVSVTVPAGVVLDNNGRSNAISDLLQWEYAESANMDFGDAPNTTQTNFARSYPTLLADNGPRHRLGGPRLGSNIDIEDDGQPAAGALGDDAAPSDDEDGIKFDMLVLTSATQNNISSFTVTASATGKLDAWIDFNRDGDWDDAGEQVAASLVLSAGSQLVPFTIPAGAKSGTTYGRFRISTDGGLQPTGQAADGEVEDHLLTIKSSSDSVAISPELGAHQVLISSGQLIIRKGATVHFQADASLITGISLTVGIELVYSFTAPNATLFGMLDYDGLGVVSITSEQAVIDISGNIGRVFGIDVLNLDNGVSQSVQFVPADIADLSTSKRLRLNLGAGDTLTSSAWLYNKRTVKEGNDLIHEYTAEVAKVSYFLDINGPREWQNVFKAVDSNGDQRVTAIDALLIINQINLSNNSSVLPFNPSRPQDFFFADVNGDGSLSPIDVLLIINELNKQAAGGEGELEPASVDSVLGAADLWDIVQAKEKRRGISS